MAVNLESNGNKSAGSGVSIKVNLPSVDKTAQENQTNRLHFLSQPTLEAESDDDYRKQLEAARQIERFWLRMRDKQLFKMLKKAICAAEESLTWDILRKVCAREADLLKDKFMNTKIRFRFGGCEFPPHIYFKIYTCSSSGTGITYVSGKRMIMPASQAARDSCKRMGHRQFYELLIKDKIHHDTYKITDEVDITTLKDYMQYLSLLDETPAAMGGKDNSWRKLSCEAVPRQTIFYDIVQYINSRKMSPALLAQMPTLCALPLNEDVQLAQLKIITEIRQNTDATAAALLRVQTAQSQQNQTARRSTRARKRARKMRKMYTGSTPNVTTVQEPPSVAIPDITFLTDNVINATENEEWEEEETLLYEWTQDLSMEQLNTTTPRLPTA